ncbi:MAG: hypothetical protein KDD37_07310 [Bdellovibrionales bacterium]|nr:hypothetical protein [Bdellovibrionales bacterium]
MKYVAMFATLLVSLAIKADWKQSAQNPVLSIETTAYRALVNNDEQVSCEHLEFRYSQIANFLKDLDWLTTEMAESSSYYDIYNYIEERSSLNIRTIASKQQFEVSYEVSSDLESANIGIIKATDFEQLVPSQPEGSYSKFSPSENGILHFTTKVNAFDICEKQSIEVLFLSNCPVEVTEDLPCATTGTCKSPYVADWQACLDIKSVRVDLAPLQAELGKRTRVIKRVW